MNLEQKFKRNKGITLVALVVTIIVLLILAGVTIATLTGDNGILTKATEASENTKKANAEEQVGLAVAGSRGTDGNIEMNNLNDNLRNIENLTYNNEEISSDETNRIKELPAIVNVDGYDILISEDGNTEEYVDTTEKVEDETPGILAGNGTSSNPYKIESIEDLVKFSQEVRNGNNYSGKYVRLEKNLNFDSFNSYVNYNKVYTEFENNGDINSDGIAESIKKEVTTGSGFIPIGTNYENAFAGTFQGNGKKISNIYININKEVNGTIYAGLFSYSRGTIEELTISGNISVINTGTNYNSNAYIGGIAGAIKYATVKKCANECEIYAEANSVALGGIVGSSYDYGNTGSGTRTILDCANKGTLRAKGDTFTDIGGIIGHNYYSGKVNYSYNIGNIIIENNAGGVRVGGIVGETEQQYSQITYCYNSGNIDVKGDTVYSIGGIAGDSDGTTNIVNCYNIGNTTGNTIQNYGGIVGFISQSSSGEINMCYNNGKINLQKEGVIGGIVGTYGYSNAKCYVNNCKYSIEYPAAGKTYEDITIDAEFLDAENMPSILEIVNNSSKYKMKEGFLYPVLYWE